GSFSEKDYFLSRSGFDEVRDFTVAVNGIPSARDNSREAGTFRIRETSNRIELVVFYRAQNESVTFEISYTIDGGVKVGPDHSEFVWTYISSRWERNTQHLEVELILPDVSSEVTRNWIRGASDAVTISESDTGFSLTSNRALSRNQQVIVRSVFPSIVIPNARVTNPELTLELVLADETRRLEERLAKERRKAKWESIGLPVGIVLLILSPIVFFVMYHKFGRRHQLGYQIPQALYQPPEDLAPALAGKVMFYAGGAEAQLMTATLFDMSRRGYFQLKEAEIKNSRPPKTPETTLVIQRNENKPERDTLLSYEKHLLDFINEAMVDGQVSLKGLFEQDTATKKQKEINPALFASNKTQAESTKWFEEWGLELQKEYGKIEVYEKESTKWMAVGIVIQLVLFLIGLGLLILSGLVLLVFSMISSIIWMLFSIAIRRRTPKAQESYYKWKAYRYGLQNARPQDFKGPNLAMHMIYAIALLVTGKKFTRMVEALNLQSNDIFWLQMYYTGVLNPALISNSISNITTSTLSSTTTFTGSATGIGAAGGGAGGGAR
ncbi:MAG: DUF2207 domain-containing protein, partial [Balneolales bacterium]|nr:DUF2207 domain-containing protein [Balneolales bacterium]